MQAVNTQCIAVIVYCRKLDGLERVADNAEEFHAKLNSAQSFENEIQSNLVRASK